MNLTAELVKEWAIFEENHPNSGLDDFCRHYLVSKREKERSAEFLGGIIPPGDDQTLAKLMDRIIKLYFIYARPSLRVIGLKSFDEFLYLNTIGNQYNPKKTSVITMNLNELSSGLLIIDRLIKKDYVAEQQDETDRRSKRLLLTYKGKSVLSACYKQISLLNELFFSDMPREDMLLCIRLLSPLELRFSKDWQKNSNNWY